MKNQKLDHECENCVVERKFHYWRGFAVASGIWFLVAVVYLHKLLALVIQ